MEGLEGFLRGEEVEDWEEAAVEGRAEEATAEGATAGEEVDGAAGLRFGGMAVVGL